MIKRIFINIKYKNVYTKYQSPHYLEEDNKIGHPWPQSSMKAIIMMGLRANKRPLSILI